VGKKQEAIIRSAASFKWGINSRHLTVAGEKEGQRSPKKKLIISKRKERKSRAPYASDTLRYERRWKRY